MGHVGLCVRPPFVPLLDLFSLVLRSRICGIQRYLSARGFFGGPPIRTQPATFDPAHTALPEGFCLRSRVGHKRLTSHLIVLLSAKSCRQARPAGDLQMFSKNLHKRLVFVCAAPWLSVSQRSTLLQVVTHVILTDIPLVSVCRAERSARL